MVYNSYGTGKTWIFEDLDSISDSREDLDTVFRENLGIQVYPYDQCSTTEDDDDDAKRFECHFFQKKTVHRKRLKTPTNGFYELPSTYYLL